MNKLHFYKYHGAGNDFIVVDGRTQTSNLSQKEIQSLCNRRFGIGADGLMILDHSPDYDFSMRYYNADGKEGTMCGNGGRCIVAFAAQEGKRDYVFGAIDGTHHAQILYRNGGETIVCLGMNNVDEIRPTQKEGFFLNTGSPHLVFFVTDLDRYDVSGQGSFWRGHPDFAPEGTNVNFVEIMPNGTLFVRTFERGVEAETFACGTGVTAAVIASYVHTKQENTPVSNGLFTQLIKTLGGDLQVSFKVAGKRFSNVQLTGPATFVFEGDIT